MNRFLLSIKFVVIFITILIYTSCPVTPNENTPFVQNYVDIRNNTFNPSSLTVPINTTVYWTNNDSAPHDVISTLSAPSFDYPSLQPGTGCSVFFSKAGTNSYHSNSPTYFTGVIIVTQ